MWRTERHCTLQEATIQAAQIGCDLKVTGAAAFLRLRGHRSAKKFALGERDRLHSAGFGADLGGQALEFAGLE